MTQLDSIQQMMQRQDAAKRAISAQMQSVTSMTYAMLVALAEHKNPQTYRAAAQIALNSTPYLFEAMGVFNIQEGQPKEGND